jgi:hypothetical protein
MSDPIPPPDLPPLALSVHLTGRRYFRVSPSAYPELCAQLDERRGFPSPTGDTLRSLPLADDCPKTEDGDILISSEIWRFLPEDESMVTDAISAGHVIELTNEEFAALMPEPEEPEA